MACAAASLIALCLFYVCCAGKPAILNEAVKLLSDRDCAAHFTLIRVIGYDSPRTVATLVNGVWTPEDGYRERVEHSSRLSLWLNRVNYNDKGHYEFTCAQELVTTVELEVLVISNNNLSVTEGDTITLPCYFKTAGDTVDFVVWERNGTLVMSQSLSSREPRYGTGFEGRVSVRSDRFELGDLSLRLEGVRPEDRGDFFCSVYKSSRQLTERGIPAAVRVTVNERRRDPTTSAPLPLTHEASQSNATVTTAFVTQPPARPFWSWPTSFITAAVILLPAVLAWLVWYLRRTNCRSRCAQPVEVETSQHGEDAPENRQHEQRPWIPLQCQRRGRDEEDGESDCIQQNMLKLNGYH